MGENNRTSWSVSVVSFGGRHLAHYQSSATYFLHGNSLGSTSQATDYSGAMSQDQLYYPWGGDWSMVGTSQEQRFTSLQHRDTTETGLDPTQHVLFHARSLAQRRPGARLHCDFYGCYCDWFDPWCGYYSYGVGFSYAFSIFEVSAATSIQRRFYKRTGWTFLPELILSTCNYKACDQSPSGNPQLYFNNRSLSIGKEIYNQGFSWCPIGLY